MLCLAFTLWLIRAILNVLGIGMGPVVIAHNYAAEINADALAVPAEERAWPLYHEASLQLRDYDWSLPVANEIRDPDSPEWKLVAEYFRRKSDALAMIRTAATRRHMGVVVDDKGAIDAVPVFAQMGVMYIPEPPSENPPLSHLVFAHFGPCRSLVRSLSFDMRLAASEGDTDRWYADHQAILGITRHLEQPATEMSRVVAIAVQALLLSELREILHRWPQACRDDQLSQLASTLKRMDPVPPEQFLAHGRLELLDVLQRWYTDDDQGSGRWTYAGYIEYLWFFAEEDQYPRPTERDRWGRPLPPRDSSSAVWLWPYYASKAASRSEVLAEWDRLTSLAVREMRKPLWEWTVEPGSVSFGADFPSEWRVRYAVVGALGVAHTPLAVACERLRQDRDATVVAIALEQHRRKHGEYPATLAQIDAGFLPTIPPDRFDGQPIKYTLRDGRPLLYSVGVDRDDDGGRPPRPGADPARWRPRPAPEDIGNPKIPQLPDGDWLLWPRAE